MHQLIFFFILQKLQKQNTMKNPTFYFLLALTLVLVTNTYGAVLDIDGDIFFRGSYYVLPVIRGRGGGVSLRGRGGELCPFDIVQESSEVDEGIPVKFSNWRPRVAFVPNHRTLTSRWTLELRSVSSQHTGESVSLTRRGSSISWLLVGKTHRRVSSRSKNLEMITSLCSVHRLVSLAVRNAGTSEYSWMRSVLGVWL